MDKVSKLFQYGNGYWSNKIQASGEFIEQEKLLYLFLTCLLLAGCRGNRYYLDKVEALWSVDYDSVMYCLLKVDSASMTSDAEDEKHIQLSDTDWKELQQMLDSGYR